MRAQYDMMCDAGDRAEDAQRDADVVFHYAKQLLDLAASDAFRANLEAVELQARAERAAQLLGGVLPQLEGKHAAEALVAKGTLSVHARGYEDRTAEADFAKAFQISNDWETGALLVDYYSHRGHGGAAAIDACQKTYEAGQRENASYQLIETLVRVCKTFAKTAKDPENPYTSIEPEYWDFLRKETGR